MCRTCGVVVGHPATFDADLHQGLQPFWLPVPHADAHGLGGCTKARACVGAPGSDCTLRPMPSKQHSPVTFSAHTGMQQHIHQEGTSASCHTEELDISQLSQFHSVSEVTQLLTADSVGGVGSKWAPAQEEWKWDCSHCLLSTKSAFSLIAAPLALAGTQ